MNPDLSERPEVRHTRTHLRELLERMRAATSSEDGTEHLVAMEELLALVEVDPTLAMRAETHRMVELITELSRQLGPLGRQADLVREHARLTADTVLSEAERARALNRLGKLNPDALEQEAWVRERLRERCHQLREQARPDWHTPHQRRALAREWMPHAEASMEILTAAAERLRASVADSLAIDPDLPEAHQLLELADRVHSAADSPARPAPPSQERGRRRLPNPAVPDLHSHPAVRRHRDELQRLIDTWPPRTPPPNQPQEWWLQPPSETPGRETVLALARRAIRALEADPTLALDDGRDFGGTRRLELFAELSRQVRPLGRQVALARAARRITQAPDLTDRQRHRGLARIGKIDEDVEQVHHDLLVRGEELVVEIESRVNPEWDGAEHRWRLARSLLPDGEQTTKATTAVRDLLKDAMAIAPELPEAHQVRATMDQIAHLLGATNPTCSAPGCEQPLPPADPGRERKYCSGRCRTRARRTGGKR